MYINLNALQLGLPVPYALCKDSTAPNQFSWGRGSSVESFNLIYLLYRGGIQLKCGLRSLIKQKPIKKYIYFFKIHSGPAHVLTSTFSRTKNRKGADFFSERRKSLRGKKLKPKKNKWNFPTVGTFRSSLTYMLGLLGKLGVKSLLTFFQPEKLAHISTS